MDLVTVVLKGVGMGPASQGMALGTPHAGCLKCFRHILAGHAPLQFLDGHGRFGSNPRVAAILPVGNDAWMKNAVAIHALLGGFADGRGIAEGGTGGKQSQQ